MRLVNHHNFTTVVHTIGEVFKLPSKTVPGMTLPLAELLDRYVKKMPVDMFPGQYSDDDDMPDVSRMDTIERLEAAMQIKQSIAQAQIKPKSQWRDLKDPVDPRDPVPPHNDRTKPVPLPLLTIPRSLRRTLNTYTRRGKGLFLPFAYVGAFGGTTKIHSTPLLP